MTTADLTTARAAGARHASEAASAPELAERIELAMTILEGVARRLARRYARVVELDDLRAFGRAALLSVVTAWDATRAPFKVWVRQKLEWAMIDGVRKETHLRSTGARAVALVAAELVAGASVEEADAPDAGAHLDRLLASRAAALAMGLLLDAAEPRRSDASPEDHASAAEVATHVRAAVAALPERHRALVEGVYWHGEGIDAVGRRLGISKSWASRIHAQAIDMLRAAIADPSV